VSVRTEAAVLDLRTYRVVPGGRAEFERIFLEGALPMLRRHGIDVVAHGPSAADDVHYYLVRAFASAEVRAEQLASFYGSEEWQQNYDTAVMNLIETYHTIVIPLGSEGDTLREALAG
jgi:hypothetical protein